MILNPESEPWIVPFAPPLERLAMELADSTGLTMTPLPSADKGGIALGHLPPFLIWKHITSKKILHLFFFQPREIGALVEGASSPDIGPWITRFPLLEMSQLLALHPDINEPTEVTLINVEQGPAANLRSTVDEVPLVAILTILNRISAKPLWTLDHIRIMQS